MHRWQLATKQLSVRASPSTPRRHPWARGQHRRYSTRSCLGVVYFVATVAMTLVVPRTLDFAAITTLYFTEALAVFIGIPVVFETLTRGKSVGRYALGLRIVRDDGGPITVRQVVVRALVGVIELWLSAGAIALIASASNSRGKRVGDMLAGTYALQTRASKRATCASHGALLARWVGTGGGHPQASRRACARGRQFLTRALALHPSSRRQMGESLSARIAPFVSPLPPQGTHPETFLTAVLAVRRDREYALEIQRLQADPRRRMRCTSCRTACPTSGTRARTSGRPRP